jgi:simple sugar transport system permease protein
MRSFLRRLVLLLALAALVPTAAGAVTAMGDVEVKRVTQFGGACAGLAGGIEVAAEYGRANASLAAGYGYTGILIAFLARFNPLAIVPMAVLLGGLGAAGGLLQRRMGLPDATVQVLQGMILVAILASETFYGRVRWFQPRGAA